MATRIGRVRGLGSAKSGPHYWWMQRLTAGANVLLLPWLLVSLVRLPVLDHATVTAWLSAPVPAVLMILLVANVFWHLRLGLQTVIEDYQHDESRVVALIIVNALAILGAALGIFSILRIAFTGTPA